MFTLCSFHEKSDGFVKIRPEDIYHFEDVPMGKVIAFANQKGGVGKSTLTVQAAFYLRKHRKKKVLVIDVDSQGNTTESILQGEPYTGTSSAALFEPELNELSIYDGTPYGVDLIGSESNSNEGYDVESRKLDVVKNPAANIEALKDAYDYILVDCPPSLGRKLLGGLVMADYVICPVKLSGYAIGGVSGMTNTIRAVQQNFNPSLKFLGVIVNEYDDSASAKSTLEYLTSETNCDIFTAKLRHRAPIDAATTMGIPVDEIRNGRRAFEEIEAVYKEMLSRIKKAG